MPIPDQQYALSRVPKIDEDLSAVLEMQAKHGRRLITIEGKVGRLQRTADQHTAQISTLQKTADQHTAQISTLQKTADQHTSQIANLQSSVDTIQATVADHGQKLELHSQQLTTLQATVDTHTKRFDGVMAMLAEILGRLPVKQ